MSIGQKRLVSLQKLRPNPQNARTHSKKQIRQIADSIRRFEFTNPVPVDEKLVVLAGHGRLAAARLIGLREIPIVSFAGLTDEEKRA